MTPAAFCQSFDERHHLWLWLQHYVPAVGEENCHVMWSPEPGDLKPEMAARYPKVQWHEDDHPKKTRFDDWWMVSRMQAFQHKLLEQHNTVIMTDVDELLVPVDGTSLVDWLVGFSISDRRFVKSIGYNVFEDIDNPGSMLRWQCATYDKTLVTKVPLIYRVGFHQAWEPQLNVMSWSPGSTCYTSKNCVGFDEKRDLALAHMHHADLRAFVEKDQRRSRGAQMQKGPTFPGQDEAAARQFFQTGIPPWAPKHRAYAEMRTHSREPVPSHWRGLNTRT